MQHHANLTELAPHQREHAVHFAASNDQNGHTPLASMLSSRAVPAYQYSTPSMEYASLASQTNAADADAHAAHAVGVAMTMSTPCELRGDAVASTSSGAVETFMDAGNVASVDASVGSSESVDVALQPIAGLREVSTHDPALERLLDADQHSHAAHPATRDAALQQQPPKHESDRQSKRVEHGSPGERKTQEPVWSAHPLHPAEIADGLQQAPSRHRLEAQVEENVQGEPSGRGGTAPLAMGEGVRRADGGEVGVGAMGRVMEVEAVARAPVGDTD